MTQNESRTEGDAPVPVQDSSQPSNIRKNSLWMFAGQMLAFGCQGIYFVLIGRALGSKEYGAFVGVVSLVSVLSQVSSFGMELVIIRDISRDRGRFSRSWGLALELSTFGFLLIMAIAIVLGHFILPANVRPLIPLVVAADALFGKLSILASKAFQGFERFGESAAINASGNISRVIVAAVLYVYTVSTNIHPTAYSWTRIYWIASFAAAVIGFGAVTWQLGLPRWHSVRWKNISDGLSFSLSGTTVTLYNDIDKTFLVSMGQSKAAGIYTAAYRIVDIASTPIYSIYSAAFPQFFREGAKSVRDAFAFSHKLMRKTVPYSAAAAVVMFAGAGLLPRILGPSFSESTAALRWLCLLPLIRCIHYAAGTTITGSVSQWVRTVQQIVVALLNILLNIVLIPRFSWQGAAAASLLSDGALAAMNWACVKWLIFRDEQRLATTASCEIS